MSSETMVTIGLCVRNAETTIKQTVESIIHQDFNPQHMELIVVDGYSKDQTLRMIKETLSKTKLHCTIFQENIGLGHARQIVVNKAIGNYIVWVDGDMNLPTDFITKQVDFMQKNPSAGIGKGKYALNEEKSLVASLENMEFVISFCQEGVTSSKVLATSGCIYRVEAIRQVGGFDEKIRGVGEDMDIEHRIRSAGWQLCVTPAAFFETHRNTWSALWKEYFWHGQGGYYLFEKNKKIVDYNKIFPPIAILSELSKVAAGYKLLNQKKVFLLPLHYIFKRIAWFLGFAQKYLQAMRMRR